MGTQKNYLNEMFLLSTQNLLKLLVRKYLQFYTSKFCIFLEVRNTTLDSLCELASQSLSFAMLSQDSITDMFNDEIESVRLNAINSLKKLSQYLEIREDQLEIMLGVLQVKQSREFCKTVHKLRFIFG